MVWGWDARGPLPADATGVATGGGTVGSASEAKVAHAWPRYEADYLKRALASGRYDTTGLDATQADAYLTKVTGNYREEADAALKGEFEQWLMGQHECNDPTLPNVYENAPGKPVRRWVENSKEANGKVGQARAGWKHTPWGRASLVHLDGVREYLTKQKREANKTDLDMQLLAEYGPHSLEQAWMYFKHWVKGRPLSDALPVEPRFEEMANDARADFGSQLPQHFHEYTVPRPDAQPEVRAEDHNAYNAALEQPLLTQIENVRGFRKELEDELHQATESRQQEASDESAENALRAEQQMRAQFIEAPEE